MPSARQWTLVATIVGSSLTFVDATVVNVALPALQADLHATITDVQWVIEAYALFLGGLILVGGSMGDQFGRKRIFLVGVVVFTVASIACGLAGLHARAHRRARGPGCRCSVPGARQPRDHQRDVRRRRSWTRDRDVVRLQRDHVGHRTGRRRLADRARQLARGVLPERAAGRDRHRAVAALHDREPRRVTTLPRRLDGSRPRGVGLGGVVFALLEWPRLDASRPSCLRRCGGGVVSLVALVVVERGCQDRCCRSACSGRGRLRSPMF